MYQHGPYLRTYLNFHTNSGHDEGQRSDSSKEHEGYIVVEHMKELSGSPHNTLVDHGTGDVGGDRNPREPYDVRDLVLEQDAGYVDEFAHNDGRTVVLHGIFVPEMVTHNVVEHYGGEVEGVDQDCCVEESLSDPVEREADAYASHYAHGAVPHGSEAVEESEAKNVSNHEHVLGELFLLVWCLLGL